MDANFVTLDDVALAYGGEGGATLAVEGLSMRIAQGALVAVVGPSGCGKSTLMKLATGLMPPTRGTVIVAGREVTGPLKISGMAFQNPTLLPWRTTLENILLPLEIVEPHRRSFRRDRAKNLAKARHLLKVVGLDKFEDRYPWQLSGGMQQRANLCRALIHEPALLMLDEPFGALDAFTREELWGVLQDLWLERRFTCVMVTHDLRESVFLADTVFVMSARPGRIIEVRDVDLARPRTLSRSFDPDFVDIVHALRDRIAVARQEAA
jgi:NitT/TauT family transport system ATP-binding protein